MATSNQHVCYIVPPYMLSGLAASSANADHLRESARRAVDNHKGFVGKREKRFESLTVPRGTRRAAAQAHAPREGIVPDSMLKHIADSDDVDEDTRACAKRDLEHIRNVHLKYQDSQEEASLLQTLAAFAPPRKDTTEKTYRAVYDAGHTDDESDLPGEVCRVEGQKASADEDVNKAYDNVGHVLDFYASIFNWKSIDDRNMHVVSSVHYGKNYENAFWDPQIEQMVFGDGHDFLHDFTGCVDVIGHELTHAVTEHTSPLNYTGQSGALNEHISDVFGIMVKQRVEDETADKADWLIGEGCLLPDVKGVALRSMKDPGSAYDDPRFGKDPQPGNFAGYVPTFEDNGGVHLYSGIPNKAFYLASVAFGGYSWDKAGRVWWETMQSGQIPARCTFIQFADVTVDKAEELFGAEAAAIVRQAWDEVGVVRKSHSPGSRSDGSRLSLWARIFGARI